MKVPAGDCVASGLIENTGLAAAEVTTIWPFPAPLQETLAGVTELKVGFEILTVNVFATLGPHEKLATQVMLPPVSPAKALMELVKLTPAHPPGNVHVYEIASWIGVTL